MKFHNRSRIILYPYLSKGGPYQSAFLLSGALEKQNKTMHSFFSDLVKCNDFSIIFTHNILLSQSAFPGQSL